MRPEHGPAQDAPKALAIIIARGGSKGIPKKNLYPLLGKPLIAWTIEAALAAKNVDRVIVSTDSEEIAAVARAHGAEVPFLRPIELAQDTTPDFPVYHHALTWLEENEGYIPHAIVQLWATSPYRKSNHIDEAIELLTQHPDADSVRSVTKPSQTPFKMWRRDVGPYLAPLLSKEYPETYTDMRPHELPRQTLPETLVQTGYLAVIRRKTIVDGNSMMGDRVVPFYHDPELYTEFDSLADLLHTEHVLKQQQ